MFNNEPGDPGYIESPPEPFVSSQGDPRLAAENISVPTPDLAAIVKAAVEAAMAPMTAKVERLAEENDALRSSLADGRSANLQGPDFPMNPDAARSVVIATRPVVENPDQYRHSGKGIVDPGGLSVNGASPMSGKNRQ